MSAAQDRRRRIRCRITAMSVGSLPMEVTESAPVFGPAANSVVGRDLRAAVVVMAS